MNVEVKILKINKHVTVWDCDSEITKIEEYKSPWIKVKSKNGDISFAVSIDILNGDLSIGSTKLGINMNIATLSTELSCNIAGFSIKVGGGIGLGASYGVNIEKGQNSGMVEINIGSLRINKYSFSWGNNK